MTAASWSQNREGLHFAVIFALKQVKCVSDFFAVLLTTGSHYSKFPTYKYLRIVSSA